MAGLKAITQYEQVQKKVDEGMKVGQAIREVATALGVSPGTVHTSYYRVGRSQNKVGRAARRGEHVASTNGTSTKEIMQNLLDAAEALSHRMESLDRREQKLRRIETTLAEAS